MVLNKLALKRLRSSIAGIERVHLARVGLLRNRAAGKCSIGETSGDTSGTQLALSCCFLRGTLAVHYVQFLTVLTRPW